MRVEEIEIAEAQLAACLTSPHPFDPRQLVRLRLMALQSAQLWRALLPQDRSVVSYSPEGSINLPACGTQLSITG
jgi:hypothetical protein